MYQTLTAWVVVPLNYFWRPQFDVNWARGPFFREQHVMPGSTGCLFSDAFVVAMVGPKRRFFTGHFGDCQKTWLNKHKLINGVARCKLYSAE